MAVEPAEKRAIAFVDGQNLFHAVRESFGYPYPNYDVRCLAESICRSSGWRLDETRFYTGIPDAADDPFWNAFWSGKLAVMGRQGVRVFSRSLRYRNKTVQLPGGTTHTFLAGEEKGIDVRIALDVIALAHRRKYDVAVIFSQDQDLSEVAEEVRAIAQEQNRWIKLPAPSPSAPPLAIVAASIRRIGSGSTGPLTTLAWTAAITGQSLLPYQEVGLEAVATNGVQLRWPPSRTVPIGAHHNGGKGVPVPPDVPTS